MIIGISGKKQSGKDSVASIMLFSLGTKVIRLAFADALKEEVAFRLGIPVKYIEDNKSHFRLILQGYGTDYRRQLCNKDYWVKIMSKKIEFLSNNFDTIIIPDVRFKNELDMVKSNGGMMLRVERPSLNCNADTHISESELDSASFDHHIINDGTLANLVDKVTTFLNTQHITK